MNTQFPYVTTPPSTNRPTSLTRSRTETPSRTGTPVVSTTDPLESKEAEESLMLAVAQILAADEQLVEKVTTSGSRSNLDETSKEGDTSSTLSKK